MTQTVEQGRAAPAPARIWRNFYRVYRVLHVWRVGPVFPGIHAAPQAFASREIAETHAAHFLARLNPPGRFIMDYVGAYPEGERAH